MSTCIQISPGLESCHILPDTAPRGKPSRSREKVRHSGEEAKPPREVRRDREGAGLARMICHLKLRLAF
eukprot:scaffold13356_cov179-Alexandrium_tamarense.AAC.4